MPWVRFRINTHLRRDAVGGWVDEVESLGNGSSVEGVSEPINQRSDGNLGGSFGLGGGSDDGVGPGKRQSSTRIRGREVAIPVGEEGEVRRR